MYSIIKYYSRTKKCRITFNCNGTRTTTWGGSIVFDNISKQYHMIAAEIEESCGMDVWLSNSQIVHATSKTLDGEYIRKEVVKGGGLFSHEPNMVQALDTGEFVVYYTHHYPPGTYKYPCYNCKNGVTENCPQNGDNDYSRDLSIPLPTKMIYTANISDNNAWSDIIDLDHVSPNEYVDSNLACYIFPNGSLIGILRNDNDLTALAYNFITATNWKDNTTYKTHELLPLSGNTVAQFGEDPFVWYDYDRDIIHSLWHYTYTGQSFPNGIHAFSDDAGKTFTAYLDFGIYPAEWAYIGEVTYTDGSTDSLDSAERPHLVLDGYTPLALTNGVRPPNSGDIDYSYTLLRPINQN